MPEYDFDSGISSSKYDFDAMTDADFDNLLAAFDVEETKAIQAVIADLAIDAADETRLRGLMAKGMAAGFKIAKGGGSLALLGLV